MGLTDVLKNVLKGKSYKKNEASVFAAASSCNRFFNA